MNGLKINLDTCIGCGACVSACLFDALSMSGDKPVVDPEKCRLCGACVEGCPVSALELDVTILKNDEKDDYKGVWVFAEQWRGKIDPSAFELLTTARELAKSLGEETAAVLIGSKIHGEAAELIEYGAEKVFCFDREDLELPDDESYAVLMEQLIRKEKPAIILYAATTFGRTLAPRIAAKMETGLTADCTALNIDTEKKLLLQTRPAFGGNVMATIICPERRPQMATVRPRVFKKEKVSDPKGSIIDLKVDFGDFKKKNHINDVVDAIIKGMRVEDAEIVVAGGAGFKDAEEFKLVHELAEALGGCVGASRMAVDLGYAPQTSQVGQTGKVIAPKLYIALGISGAIQHMVGMENSEFIVAVNTDPDAPIFQVADIGIVGDVKKVVPAILEEIRNRQ